MKKIIFVVFVLAAILIGSQWHFASKANMQGVSNQQIGHIYFQNIESGYPKTNLQTEEIVKHLEYHLSYNEQHEQANWVAYILTKEHLQSGVKAKRANNFRIDPKVSTSSAKPSDYVKSGYDKGHIAPAGDMSWNEEAMSESFFMSNMSPQKPEFNRGIWKSLEEKVRNWVIDNDSLYVVSGPVFKEDLGIIGEEQVTVPGHYFKVVFDISYPTYKAIAFYFPNDKAIKSLAQYAISVSELEKITGFNFFAKQNPKKMREIESKINVNDWRW